MMKALIIYEIQYYLGRPSFYLFLAAFFLISFVSLIGSGGFFDAGPENGLDNHPLLINSPSQIHRFIHQLNQFFLFLSLAYLGDAATRDFRYRFHSLLFAYPLVKQKYFWAKFISGQVLFGLICLVSLLGLGMGELMPGLNQSLLGPTRMAPYLYSFFLFTLPNCLLFGMLVYGLGLGTRHTYSGFAGILGLFLFRYLLQKIFYQETYLLALLDPLGQYSSEYLMRDWNREAQNSRSLPWNELILYNRLIWLVLMGGFAYISYQYFSLEQSAKALITKRRKQKRPPLHRRNWSYQDLAPPLALPPFHFIRSLYHLSCQQVLLILKGRVFLVFCFLGMACVYLSLIQVTQRADFTLLPLTHLILSIPSFFYGSFVLVFSFFYAGQLVHRERSHRFSPLLDLSPLPDWVFMGAKLLALVKIQLLMLFLLMATGLGLQIQLGYDNFEIDLYFFQLFGPFFLYLMLWALMALVVHTFIPHFYLASFGLLVLWLGLGVLSDLGFRSRVLLFNFESRLPYSDMNAYGDKLLPYLYVKLYWLVLCLLCLIITYFRWPRGQSASWSEILQSGRRKWRRAFLIPIIGLSLIAIFLGIDIYQKALKTGPQSELSPGEALRNFKENFAPWAQIPQPKILALKLYLDLYPERRSFEAQGHYLLKNMTESPIDTLLLKGGFDEITEFTLEEGSRLIAEDPYFKFKVFRLARSIPPGDSLRLDFKIHNQANDFFRRNASVLENGSFLRSDILPRIGYFPALNEPGQTTHNQQINYQSQDSDRLSLEVQLSTRSDQRALAPGQLIRKWRKDQRNYYLYQGMIPLKFSFGFLSARYQSRILQKEGIEIEVFHQPSHKAQIEAIQAGILASLAYNEAYFGAYPFEEIRVAEFPNSEGSYATAFGNLLPISESRFVIAPPKDSLKIHLPFYIPAHEICHQWWGNQLLPAQGPGALFLTESICEYLSLQIYQRAFGEGAALHFLEQQHRRYWQGKKWDANPQTPLVQVSKSQSYLAYGKGSIALHCLAHYWGEENLNRALNSFLKQYKNQGPPYPRAIDLINEMKRACPDSLLYLIEDYFERDRAQQLRIAQVQINSLSNHKWKMDLSIHYRKENSQGEVFKLNRNELVEVAFYDRKNKPIAQKVLKINQVKETFHFEFDQKPYRMQVDPSRLLLQKNRSGNSIYF